MPCLILTLATEALSHVWDITRLKPQWTEMQPPGSVSWVHPLCLCPSGAVTYVAAPLSGRSWVCPLTSILSVILAV